MVLRDLVELEAKGQASAQITTGTIVIRGQKIKKMINFGEFSRLALIYENFDNFDNFRVNTGSGINFRNIR